MNGADQLARLRSALREQRPIPRDIKQWLERGIAEFEAGERLENALALHTPHEARRRRNEHIQQAGRLLPVELPATARATAIERAAAKFRDYLDEPDLIDMLDGWEAEVFRALRYAKLPSWHTIRQLIA